jgi:ATP-dependent Lon protease
VKSHLEIVPVKWIDQVLDIALESAPQALADEEPPKVEPEAVKAEQQPSVSSESLKH